MQTRKPRVLRIINRLNLGGPTYNATYLTKFMEDEFETLLIAGMKDETEASSDFIVENLGIKPHYVKHMYRSLHPLKDHKSVNEIRKIIREFKPDIVHTHASKSGAVGRWAAIREGVPVVIHTFHGHIFHSYFSSLSTRVFLEIERFLAKRSTHIIAISELQKKELSLDFKICSPEKMEVIPLGFDLHRFQENTTAKRKGFREKYQIKDDEVAIGIIGRLVPVKNHTFFLEAVKKLSSETNHPYKVLIIGDGELRKEIEEKAKSLNLDYTTEKDSVHDKKLVFTSWIKEVDVATSGLDIIALTSLNEGTPVSLIEASAAGRPIVSTNVGGIRDVVDEGVNAFIVDKDDINGFAEKLKLLVEDSNLRKQMGIEGIQIAFSKFSYTRLVEQMKDLYKRSMREKNVVLD